MMSGSMEATATQRTSTSRLRARASPMVNPIWPNSNMGDLSCGMGLRRPQRPGDQAEATDQEDQHEQRIEQAGRAKVDLQVGEDANKNNHGTGPRQEPASKGTSVHKEQTNAQKQGQQGQPKGIVSPPAPGPTGHHHLIGEEIAPCDNHDEAQEKSSQPA